MYITDILDKASVGERASTHGRKKKWKFELHEYISTSGNEELKIRRVPVNKTFLSSF